MKKLFISVGLAAAGTAGLHAAFLDPDTKDWLISGTLRGFYDDNFLTSTPKKGSVGFEINPSIKYNAPLTQTELGIRYTYGLFYFQARADSHQNPVDQTHQFDLWIEHAFNPRWSMVVADTVGVAQDPPLTDRATATTRRVEGNNLQNTLDLSLHTDWTRLFSTTLKYQNTYVRYDNRKPAYGPLPFPFITVIPSLAGLLDRLDQTFGVEGEWLVSRTTKVNAGYMFEAVNFTAGENTAFDPVGLRYYTSSARDNYSHFLYVGADHSFLENLRGTFNLGGQYTTYPNDPNGMTAFGPYADASLIYTFGPAKYAQVGFHQSRNATDAIQLDKQGHITDDQESSVFYFSVSEPLSPRLSASLVGHYQHSIYHHGAFNSQAADFYNLGLNFDYAFARHFSTDVGYNLDYYTSAAGGGYSRNRLYLGLTATY